MSADATTADSHHTSRDGAASLPLDELVITVVVDNATDSLSSIGPGVPQLPEMAIHMMCNAPTRHLDGHPCVDVLGHHCVACHGFSALLRGTRDGTTRTALFDVGPYGDVWLDNAERLGIDLASIEAVFLSHWHWDHSGGLPAVVGAIAADRRAAGFPDPIVDLHPDRPDQRGIRTPGGPVGLLPPEPTFEAIAAAGALVETHAEAHPLADGWFLGSGAIERVTTYETGLVGHVSFHGDVAVPDPLIMDERFLAAHVRGRGVTVLSACSHAGVVNACLGAGSHYPGVPIDVVLGGYHLAGGAMEPRIDETVRDLAELIDPRLVAPGHCTGWRAAAALAARFAPDRYGPSVVGTTYVLSAEGG
ncbi:MAG: MBL fold metallo-hydrolase [Acidimicrobiales bacterium]|nr:MBL fold metallo-hydrolase [Acidimicrobiales bacterium]